MKKIGIIFVLTIVAITAIGQNSLIGVKGGVNWTGQTSSYFQNEEKIRTGLAVGLTYDYTFKKYFSAGADIIYNQRGFSLDWPLLSDNQGNVIKDVTVYYNYDYITLPLKAGFNYGKKFYGFINLGITPSMLVSAKVKNTPVFIDENGTLVPTHYVTINVFQGMEKFDIGGFAEIGAGYKIKERYWLYSSVSYQHSFTSFSNENYWGKNSKMRYYGMTLSFGMKIQIN